jgi:hypothetical protein
MTQTKPELEIRYVDITRQHELNNGEEVKVALYASVEALIKWHEDREIERKKLWHLLHSEISNKMNLWISDREELENLRLSMIEIRDDFSKKLGFR